MPSLELTLRLTPGPGEDPGAVLAELGRRLLGFDLALASGQTAWTAECADQYLEQLATNARVAFRFIVEHAPRVPIADVLAVVDAGDPQTLGGMMSSMGVALKKVADGQLPLPAASNSDGYYYIHHEVAQIFLGAYSRRDSAGLS